MAMNLSVHALGRQVKLGMLYDIRTGSFIEDQNLWNEDVIKANTKSRTMLQSSVDFTADDSIANKSKFLEITGSSKSSALLGFFPLSGSSRYLQDYREYSKQSRLMCKYSIRNLFSEFLFQEATTAQIPPALLPASHFVSAICYGADVIVVFELDESNLRDYEGEDATVQKRHNVFWTREENISNVIKDVDQNSNNVKFKIHGDIKLSPEPDTLEKAIELCKDLPTLVSKEGNTKPMTVYLTSISQIMPEVSPTAKFEPVTDRTLTDVENNLEKLLNLKIKCNDLLAQPACSIDEKLKNTLRETQERISNNESEFKSKLRLLLNAPNSKSGDQSIADEVKLYKNSANNPKLTESTMQNIANDVSVVNSFAKLIQSKASDKSGNKSDNRRLINVKMPTSDYGSSYRQKYKALRQMADKISPDQISGKLEIKITEEENIEEPEFSVVVDNPENNESATENDKTVNDKEVGGSSLASDIICTYCGERNCVYELERRRRDANNDNPISNHNPESNESATENVKTDNEKKTEVGDSSTASDIICTLCGERNCVYELERRRRGTNDDNPISNSNQESNESATENVETDNEKETEVGDSRMASDSICTVWGVRNCVYELERRRPDANNDNPISNPNPESNESATENVETDNEKETEVGDSSTASDIICTFCGERNCVYELERRRRSTNNDNHISNSNQESNESATENVETQKRISSNESEFKSKLRLSLNAPNSKSGDQSIADEVKLYKNSANNPKLTESTMQNIANDVSVVNSFAKLIQSKASDKSGKKSDNRRSINVKMPTSNYGSSYRQKYKALRQMADKKSPDQISGKLEIKITEEENFEEPEFSLVVDNLKNNESATENDETVNDKEVGGSRQYMYCLAST